MQWRHASQIKNTPEFVNVIHAVAARLANIPVFYSCYPCSVGTPTKPIHLYPCSCLCCGTQLSDIPVSYLCYPWSGGLHIKHPCILSTIICLVAARISINPVVYECYVCSGCTHIKYRYLCCGGTHIKYHCILLSLSVQWRHAQQLLRSDWPRCLLFHSGQCRPGGHPTSAFSGTVWKVGSNSTDNKLLLLDCV